MVLLGFSGAQKKEDMGSRFGLSVYKCVSLLHDTFSQ